MTGGTLTLDSSVGMNGGIRLESNTSTVTLNGQTVTISLAANRPYGAVYTKNSGTVSSVTMDIDGVAKTLPYYAVDGETDIFTARERM